MQLRSDSFEDGGSMPPRLAMGRWDGDGATLSANRSPHLAWSEIPAGMQSFVVLCIDPDVPTVAGMVGKPGVEIPAGQPRCEFVHWAMVDIPAEVRGFAEGAWSDGVTVGGKRDPHGPHSARHGLNDYTGWFADDAMMRGDYLGYDGPFPPPNDLRLHRYFFRVYALDVPRLNLPDRFTAADVRQAMHGHVLAEAQIHGTYTLHPRLRTG